MSQRFHFDLTNGLELMQDAEGVDASGPDEAIEEARAALEDMLSLEGTAALGDGWRLIIRDESGMTVRAISLDEAAVH